VILIAGPTASGKTGLALKVADQKNDTHIIINADSAQIYSHLPILSAQPTQEEMASIPHRLFGYLDGSKSWSAASWAKDAKHEIQSAHDMGKIPILVGGTGLYIRTLLDGIAPIPDIDPNIRIEVRSMTNEESYSQLQSADPFMAKALHPSDTTRIARALEVIRSTNISIKTWRENKEGGIAEHINLKPLLLLPPREWLYNRCDRRFLQMFDGGALDEVQSLLEHDPPPDSPLWRAIGVKELRSYIEGHTNRAEAIERGQIATRQYAKRQYTWFRNQSPEHWSRTNEEISYNNLNEIITLFQ